MKERPVKKWALLWRSNNKLDGRTRRVMWSGGLPLIFQTKREAAAYAKEHHGYIATRADLRREPHGWRVPMPVRVNVRLDPVSAELTQ